MNESHTLVLFFPSHLVYRPLLPIILVHLVVASALLKCGLRVLEM